MSLYKRPISFVWKSFKGHKGLLYIFFISKVIEGIFYVVLPILAKLEMDQLVEKNEQLFGIIHMDSYSIFLVILIIIFGMKLLGNILQSVINLFQYDFLKVYENNFSRALYERLKNTEPGIFLNARNKRFLNEVLDNANTISNMLKGFVGDFISNFFVIVGIFTVLSLINIWIFVVLIVSAIIIYFLSRIRYKIEEKQNFEEQYEFDEKIWIVKNEIGRNFSSLVSSGGFMKMIKQYDDYNDTLRRKIKERQKSNMIIDIFSFITEDVSNVIVKLFVGYGIFFSGMSVGTMTMTIMYVGRIETVLLFFRNFKFQYNQFTDNLKKLDIFLDLTEIKTEKQDNNTDIENIFFKNVEFSYPNFAKEELRYLSIIEERIKSYGKLWSSDKDKLHLIEEAKKELKIAPPIILKGVDLAFEKGKTYGIVGKNGAGKTTITSLLQGFFSSYKGNIAIDNNEVLHLKRDFFENNVSIVNQVPYIIEGMTIKQNILLGVNKEYKEDEIMNYLTLFGVDKKVNKLRLGLESVIGYDNNFSGGEKQILNLIRVILQNKKILIMDEGTNQLDAENEMKVMEILLKNKKDKIVVFITHRMTTIKNTDYIYCIKDGKVETGGTHKELLKGKNIYKDFWGKQVGEEK